MKILIFVSDVVASQNYPDSKYFSASVSNTVWTPKITTSMSGVKSEGLCSALCTLRYPNCQLYVFLTPVCYMGTLATNNGNVGANPGTYTMMTRICKLFFISHGSGSKNFDPGQDGSIFCGSGWVSQIFKFFPFGSKKSLRVGSKSTRVSISCFYKLLKA